MHGIESKLRSANRLMSLITYHNDGSDAEYLLDLYQQQAVSAFIFLSVQDSVTINRLYSAGVPIISSDHHDDNLLCSSVSPNNQQGCKLALSSLTEKIVITMQYSTTMMNETPVLMNDSLAIFLR